MSHEKILSSIDKAEIIAIKLIVPIHTLRILRGLCIK